MSRPEPPRRDFAILFCVLMSVSAGNTALTAVLPAIGRELRLPDTVVAGVFSLSALLWAVTAPIWARMSDRRGRKPLIQLGLLGFGLSMASFALVVHAGMSGWLGPLAVFIGLLVTRGLFGLTGSASNPAAQAFVADRTTPEERTPALAVLASAFGLGTVLGPAIAPFMALPPIGLIGPILGFAVLAFLMLAVVTRGLVESPLDLLPGVAPPNAAAEPRGVWRDTLVRPFLIYAFVLVSVQAANVSVLGFHVIDELALPPAKAQTFIGVAMMAGAAAGLLAQWGLIRMLRMSPRSLMRWGCGLACLGNAAMMVAPDYGTLVFAYALASLGFGFARPGFTAGASLAAPAGSQGAVAGALTAVIGASFVVAPVAGVALYEWVAAVPFAVNTAACIALLFYAIKNPALRRSKLVTEPAPALE